MCCIISARVTALYKWGCTVLKRWTWCRGRIFCARKIFLPESNHYQIIFELVVNFFFVWMVGCMRKHIWAWTKKIAPYCHFYKLSQKRGSLSKLEHCILTRAFEYMRLIFIILNIWIDRLCLFERNSDTVVGHVVS